MYQLPTLPEMLFSSIFSHLHTTALWHIRLLLRTVPATHSLTHSFTHSLTHLCVTTVRYRQACLRLS